MCLRSGQRGQPLDLGQARTAPKDGSLRYTLPGLRDPHAASVFWGVVLRRRCRVATPGGRARAPRRRRERRGDHVLRRPAHDAGTAHAGFGAPVEQPVARMGILASASALRPEVAEGDTPMNAAPLPFAPEPCTALRPSRTLRRRLPPAGRASQPPPDTTNPQQIDRQGDCCYAVERDRSFPAREGRHPRPRQGNAIMGSIAEIASFMKKNELMLVTAESCTAGLIAARLADIPGAGSLLDCAIRRVFRPTRSSTVSTCGRKRSSAST